jgi:hypothetical protein
MKGGTQQTEEVLKWVDRVLNKFFHPDQLDPAGPIWEEHRRVLREHEKTSARFFEDAGFRKKNDEG